MNKDVHLLSKAAPGLAMYQIASTISGSQQVYNLIFCHFLLSCVHDQCVNKFTTQFYCSVGRVRFLDVGSNKEGNSLKSRL